MTHLCNRKAKQNCVTESTHMPVLVSSSHMPVILGLIMKHNEKCEGKEREKNGDTTQIPAHLSLSCTRTNRKTTIRPRGRAPLLLIITKDQKLCRPERGENKLKHTV